MAEAAAGAGTFSGENGALAHGVRVRVYSIKQISGGFFEILYAFFVLSLAGI